MKGRHFFLMAMGMVCWVVWGQGAITTHYEDGDLVVWTDNPGESGYKGCDVAHLTPVVAYVFELQRRNSGGTPTCSARSRGRWRTVDTQDSDDGQTVFTNIPEGHYRVICRVGKAIGCEIAGADEGYSGRSIVYEREVSGVVDLGMESREEVDLGVGDLGEDGLVVFPNPAEDAFTIVLSKGRLESRVQIIVVNLLGQEMVVMERNLDANQVNYQWQVDAAHFPSGTYWIKVSDQTGKSLSKNIVILKD